MEHGSTLCVGSAGNKMAATLKMHKWHVWKSVPDYSLYEPHQSFSSAFMNIRSVNVTGEYHWCTRPAVYYARQSSKIFRVYVHYIIHFVYLPACLSLCMYVCTMYVSMYVCMYVLCMYVCTMYVCMCVCMYVCMYVIYVGTSGFPTHKCTYHVWQHGPFILLVAVILRMGRPQSLRC